MISAPVSSAIKFPSPNLVRNSAPINRISVRTKFNSRLYDMYATTKKNKKFDEDFIPRPNYDVEIPKIKAGYPAGPEKAPEGPKPFVPYYRTKHLRGGDPDRGERVWKTTPAYTVDDLARVPDAYKSWKQQLEDKKTLDRNYLGGKKGVGADPKLVGTLNEAHEGRFRKEERESNKKVLDPALNFRDHGFEIDEETHHYTLNGTRVPQKFDHWIEEPGSVKTARDLRLLKKIERAKARAAEKHKLKAMGVKKPDRELDQKNVVTRRMLRVSNMLLEEINNALAELPRQLASKALTSNTVGHDIAESNIIASGNVNFIKVEVSRDLLHAKVFWECEEGHTELVQRELERAAPTLRHLVTQAVDMKFSPELRFVRDVPSQKEQQTNELLKIVEKTVKLYDEDPTSPYLPPEPSAKDTYSPLSVKLQKSVTQSIENIPLPVHDKLIKSRWISKAKANNAPGTAATGTQL